ncbi:LysE family translocator [Verrucomicrobiales bacterium]|jgi:threonine/homoserine/homoserine lactone efflux protein|nr:LysE family translocator [Verrucomicrobiales bacterium]MDB4527179.1 LysE family translocator [bacterium]NCF85571.1 LysE family transporter [Verrucomicrobiaceae bacterium]MDA7614751.1 LysE family translocator [Verrucomicrobiales bacterium]MDB2346887.1 LysE family translocator [Verrucomicrobiales bacterium]
MELTTFAIAMAAGQLTPGPDMLLILKNTLNRGFRNGLATITGICVGIVVHVTLVLTGTAALLITFPALLRTVQVLGAVYLLWIASKLLRHVRTTAKSRSPTTSQPSSLSQGFREGLVTNLTNVKVVILFTSLLAPLAADPQGQSWLFGLTIIIEAALIWPLFAWFMLRPRVRTTFYRWQGAFNALFAILLIAFAIRLLAP